MKLFGLVLILFLLAFAGLAIGLIVRNRSLRSGCGHVPSVDHGCRCEEDLDKNMCGQTNQCCKEPPEQQANKSTTK